ncbi:UbiH/UbiF/VisC/COQ6 family ubiquinone biosynthesis hydroxylase [Noviherbaspirillum sedimenti]|uniref:UbiH/UbiF/VisC/COQ6 family ubiquinone biosynthesis hydroxylase n=1 Tax=Noviherbaspirillum sedimenti TaxID=2320865 RepID=A0A3A3G2J4_9BURK|nr:UbiH/UbiF/VisC/COQ6 family ubiquinone biosynthesis hydroxylase [Noviherbaspirillum sedimenti]RJG02151.1 UbiH/UbiF/VisC/COQ6 family ubiquinone biosynthesis hydroxylase [Noviherbaspirillum sedimenti]
MAPDRSNSGSNSGSNPGKDFDIAILGAGPVGLALASLLVRRGAAPARIALIDAKTLDQVAQDPRSIALSHGSRQILEGIGAWPRVADPIHQIHVSRRGHFGRTLIDRSEFGVPALGYVTRYGQLVTALSDAAYTAGAQVIRPAHADAVNETADGVDLQLENGTALSTRILVQAEGGVFGAQTTKSLRRDYGQIAIIAHVKTSAPLPQRAFERFTDEGPLALLPQDDGYALVWCAHPASTEHLIGLPDTAFLAALGEAFGNRLGRFTQVSQRNTFPLGLNAGPATSARTVAIGNAAQTLHPVAGQGLNLGLRDATVLARLLAQDASPAMLERFATEQKADRDVTIRLTDVMARIFVDTPQRPAVQGLLGLSLGLFDVFKPAKKILAEQMMFGWR